MKNNSNNTLLYQNLTLFNELLLQNFDWIPNIPSGREEYYGGSVSLADYCPYNQEFTWRANNTIVRGSHCLYEDNNPRKFSHRI